MRAAYLGMDLIARFVIVPLSLASLLTGLVQSLGTPWGLFRHYWVLIKLVIDVLASIILLKYLQTLSSLAGLAAETTLSSADLRRLRIPMHVVHATAALLALLVNTTLSVYKPRGMTRFGQRKQHDERTLADAGAGPDHGATTSTPRWVQVFGIVALVLVLLLIIRQVVVGGHGPGRHGPPSDHAGHTPPEDGR